MVLRSVQCCLLEWGLQLWPHPVTRRVLHHLHLKKQLLLPSYLSFDLGSNAESEPCWTALPLLCCLFAIEIVHYILFDAFNVVGISLYLHTRGFIDGFEYICPAMSGWDVYCFVLFERTQEMAFYSLRTQAHHLELLLKRSLFFSLHIAPLQVWSVDPSLHSLTLLCVLQLPSGIYYQCRQCIFTEMVTQWHLMTLIQSANQFQENPGCQQGCVSYLFNRNIC